MPALILAYGLVAYVLFLGAFLYAIGFVANLGVPRGIDMPAPIGDVDPALAVNLALLVGFALQHSVMARPWFKSRWTRVIPPAAERSTYVLVTSLLFGVLFACWQPMPAAVWSLPEGPLSQLAWGVCGLGWLVVLVSTFLLDHFELFGLKQVFFHFLGRELPRPKFRTPLLYRLVRHPIMLGFVVAFWSTPHMSVGRLVFALGTTAYILVAIRIEERDLVAAFGDEYRAYQSRVSMLFPGRSPTR